MHIMFCISFSSPSHTQIILLFSRPLQLQQYLDRQLKSGKAKGEKAFSPDIVDEEMGERRLSKSSKSKSGKGRRLSGKSSSKSGKGRRLSKSSKSKSGKGRRLSKSGSGSGSSKSGKVRDLRL